MCGIFGVALKDKNKYKSSDLKKIVQILFKLSESRGKEASGLAIKSKSSIDILKSPVRASHFLKNSSYKQFFNKVIDKLAQEDGGSLAIIGHSRLATHGTEANNQNNQPVVKDKAVCVHNGIIANDEKLWQQFPQLKRDYQVDTEVFLSLLQMFLAETNSMSQALQKTFEAIEGSVSVAVLFNNNYSLLLATNTGSLYILDNQTKDTLIFASERYILEQFCDKAKGIDLFDKEEVKQLRPGCAIAIDIQTFKKSELENFSVSSHPEIKFISYEDSSKSVSSPEVLIKNNYKLSPETEKVMYGVWKNLYSLYDEGKIKRCAKCLFPETMTFIDFDESGVCNYCRNHKKIELKREEELKRIVSEYRRSDGRPDCLVGFSGGRDSSYGLHYVKKVLKMNPVAYTYDWGVLTDLGRRNQARVCGKLGVEHIIMSADIRRKRKNILANLNAWLKKPEMGMIPILMAGDKKHIYCGEWLRKKMGVGLIIQSAGSGLENEFFKIGLAGVRITSEIPSMKIPVFDKLRATAYYAHQYLRNPSYFNWSLLDTLMGYYYGFFQPENRLNLYNYIQWDEEEILLAITNEYNWEREPDTVATWRIDDGTASFYNYIYLTVMGLTEFDTFRSMQIREGQIERAKAYQLIKEENKPRFDSLEWYARTIDFDINKAIKRINEIPKFYLPKN